MGRVWNSTIERKARLKSVGRRKKRLRRLGLADGPLCSLVRGQRCSVPGCMMPGVPHHVDHAGLRLDWLVERTDQGLAVSLIGNVAPLCCGRDGHHEELHAVGRPLFERDHDLNLAAEALWWGQAFERMYPERYHELVEAA